MNLINLGFTDNFQKQYKEFLQDKKLAHYVPARVTLEHKHLYRVVAEDGEWLASLPGQYLYNALTKTDFPAVGDWVLVEKLLGEEKAVIHRLFTRQSKFSRKIAGTTHEEQIVASNVDLVFLVMSCNVDFNVRRLERYLIAAWDSGAKPVIVLTKADLCEDVDVYIQQAESVAFGVEIIAVNALNAEDLGILQNMLCEGVTAALMGSSGVGKSTLTNALMQQDLMKVSGIREDDAKGHHTTTHRELVLLPSGGCLIDTPGMRELQLWENGESITNGFSDIEALMEQCRFRDCTHKKEPGCAVQEAVSTGELEQKRLQSYFKLKRELAFVEQKTQLQQKLMEKRTQKKISKLRK